MILSFVVYKYQLWSIGNSVFTGLCVWSLLSFTDLKPVALFCLWSSTCVHISKVIFEIEQLSYMSIVAAVLH